MKIALSIMALATFRGQAAKRGTARIGLSASFSIRRRAGGLYYSLDCRHRSPIQARIINDLTLHSLAFGFQKSLQVLERGRQVGGEFAEFIYRI